MPREIAVPRLGWSMEEGTFRNWLKAAGDPVLAGEPLFVLEGEKAAQDIEALDAGTLWIPPDAPRPGDTVKVGRVLGWLLAPGEAPPTASPATEPATIASSEKATKASPRLPRAAGPAARRMARKLGIDLDAVVSPDPTGRVVSEDVTLIVGSRTVASPRARRRARELNVDWRTVAGTGRDGRVRERDLLALSARTIPPTDEPAPAAPGRHEPASPARRIIAARMLAGVNRAAPVTLFGKVDATALVAYRETLRDRATDPLPSYNDILVKLVATALAEDPQLNACWYRDGIYAFDEINVAVAVDTESGLVAPVIRNVPALAMAEIAGESRRLIERARAGTLAPGDLRGGTFTVTNLGSLGIDHFTPILNLPQAAILGVGRIVREPVVRDDAIVVGETMALSLTFDHRVVDGAPAARWLRRLGELIGNPAASTVR